MKTLEVVGLFFCQKSPGYDMISTRCVEYKHGAIQASYDVQSGLFAVKWLACVKMDEVMHVV